MLLGPRNMVSATGQDRDGIRTLMWLTSASTDRIISANDNDVVQHTLACPTERGLAIGLETPLHTTNGEVNLLVMMSDEYVSRLAATFAVSRGTHTNYRQALIQARKLCATTHPRVITLCSDNSSIVLSRIHVDIRSWARLTGDRHMSEVAGRDVSPEEVRRLSADARAVYGESPLEWLEVSEPEAEGVIGIIRTAWTLLHSPEELDVTATERSSVASSRSRKVNKTHKIPDIDVIDIKRRAKSHGTVGDVQIHHDHRWTVRGHWRNQTCGPKGSQRRLVWIDSHIRGPEDAPLMVRPKVFRF